MPGILAVLTLGLEPFGWDPKSSPDPRGPEGCFVPSYQPLTPSWVQELHTGWFTALLWKAFRTQVALAGLAAELAQQLWE